jgi:signal transduction histidine kinase
LVCIIHSRWIHAGIVGAIIALTMLGLFFTGPGQQPAHDILVRLCYIPIVLGGLWFGIRGGLGTAGLITLIFLPRMLLVDHGGMTVGYILEIPVFLAVGMLVGLVVDRERQYRRGLEKQAETLAQSHRELREQTRLLLEKEMQLHRADRLSALGQLSAGLAHEIRNPLGSIKGAVEILQEDSSPGHPKAEFYAILLKEVQRLNDVLTSFLSFARPVTPHLAPVDVRAVIAALEGLISGQAHAHRVRLSTTFHAEASWVMADEGLLKQAFLNIMLNAVEAMRSGGDLTVSTRLATRGAPEDQGEALEIAFGDTGPGIPEEDLSRIFDPFFTTKNDGTGLGLAITHRIIESHHGTIKVVSRRGTGTTFTVALPLEGARPA